MIDKKYSYAPASISEMGWALLVLIFLAVISCCTLHEVDKLQNKANEIDHKLESLEKNR